VHSPAVALVVAILRVMPLAVSEAVLTLKAPVKQDAVVAVMEVMERAEQPGAPQHSSLPCSESDAKLLEWAQQV
jgi:hypothetical protein